MTFLPGHRMEHGGHDEQPRQTCPIHPCRDGLPLVIREEVQHWAAQDTGNDPELKRSQNMYLLFLYFLNIISVYVLKQCLRAKTSLFESKTRPEEGWIRIKNKSSCHESTWPESENVVLDYFLITFYEQVNIFMVLVLLWTQEHVD